MFQNAPAAPALYYYIFSGTLWSFEWLVDHVLNRIIHKELCKPCVTGSFV